MAQWLDLVKDSLEQEQSLESLVCTSQRFEKENDWWNNI
jgi:hypothetical protein